MQASQSIRLFSFVHLIAMLLELLEIIHPDGLATLQQATHRRQRRGLIWEVTQLLISSSSGLQIVLLGKQMHWSVLHSQRVDPILVAAFLCLSVYSSNYSLIALFVLTTSASLSIVTSASLSIVTCGLAVFHWLLSNAVLLSSSSALLSSTLVLVSLLSSQIWLQHALILTLFASREPPRQR